MATEANSVIFCFVFSDDKTTDQGSLFHPSRKKIGAKDVECQRISQVLTQAFTSTFIYWLLGKAR